MPETQNPLDNPQQLQPPKPHWHFHLPTWAWVSILIVAAFAVSYYAWVRSLEEPVENGYTCIQVITTARNTQTGEIRDFPTPCDVPAGWEKVDGEAMDETADWQTYRNEEYGFEMKYPNNIPSHDGLFTVSTAELFYFCPNRTIYDGQYITLDQISSYYHPRKITDSDIKAGGIEIDPGAGSCRSITFDESVNHENYQQAYGYTPYTPTKLESAAEGVSIYVAGENFREVVGSEFSWVSGNYFAVVDTSHPDEPSALRLSFSSTIELALVDQILSSFRFTRQDMPYFQIKEWGVEFEAERLNNIVYVFVDEGNVVSFSTQALMELDSQTAGSQRKYCGPESNPIGSIARSEERTRNGDIHIDEYYYYFITHQATCSDNEQVQELTVKISDDLHKSFESLRRISL